MRTESAPGINLSKQKIPLIRMRIAPERRDALDITFLNTTRKIMKKTAKLIMKPSQLDPPKIAIKQATALPPLNLRNGEKQWPKAAAAKTR